MRRSIETDTPEQTKKTQIRRNRTQRQVRVYTVCHSSSCFWTYQQVVKCTCSNEKYLVRQVWANANSVDPDQTPQTAASDQDLHFLPPNQQLLDTSTGIHRGIKGNMIRSYDVLGLVVQSIVSLTVSLVIKMLTVLVSTISDSQVFLQKNVSSFCKCYSPFFSKNINVYATFNDQSFNDTLTNDIVSFEQLGPDV